MPVTSAARGARPVFSGQRGGAAVEFAFVVLFFLTLIFGILELARAMYVCNTLQEVTRRAAALASRTDFSDSTAMQHVREHAIFRSSPGFLMFAEPITDAHIKIDYMAITPDGSSLKMTPISSGSLPANPESNRAVCMAAPNHASCIRLVRARVCRTGDAECNAVPYQSILSLIPIPFPLPLATTIVNAESLGLRAGVPSTPCGC